VGCGTGIMTSLPLATYGYTVHGIDLDNASIDLAQELAHKLKLPNARFICADVSTLDQKEKFDIAICSEVLGHLANPELLLMTIKSLIKEFGILIVTVPNGYGWFEMEQFCWDLLHMDRFYSFGNRLFGFIKAKLGCIFGTSNMAPGPMIPIIPASLSQTPHIQRFTIGRLQRLFSDCGLDIVDIRSSSLFAGKFTHLLFGHFKWFVSWNKWMADLIPASLASGWYFVLRNTD